MRQHNYNKQDIVCINAIGIIYGDEIEAKLKKSNKPELFIEDYSREVIKLYEQFLQSEDNQETLDLIKTKVINY